MISGIKAFVLTLSVSLLIPTTVNGQNIKHQNSIQCGYHFLKKNDPKGKPVQYLNMRLDYCDGKSVFYDQFSFERDSLRLLAFDENGKTKNQEEYQKIRSLPRPRLEDVTFADFKNSEFTQCYKEATISIRGTYEMNAPAWKLAGETRTVKGYNCKKASAKYLGRTWIVWYTEDIPLPAGPWMLWGAPGLIVAAEDSEGLFSFQLKGATKHYVLSMKETEQMICRLMTDVSYLSEMVGIRSGDIDKIADRMKYISLIPSDYWKGK